MARDCHLCERAREDLAALGYEAAEVDITGDPELERRYRASIPVVEIDGAREFVYHVSPALLERRITAAQARRPAPAS